MTMELARSSSVRSTTATTTTANDDTTSTSTVVPSLTCQIETGDLDLTSSITSTLSDNQSPTYSDYSTSPSKLSTSNFRASRQLSVRSCNSVRAIGTIPIGGLVVLPEQHSKPEETERFTQKFDRIAEEKSLRAVSTGCLANGDVFRLLELPSNFIVGHDDIALMTTKPGDDGFRDISPGPHFLWVQQLSLTEEQQGQTELRPEDLHGPAPRCGYWYVAKQTGQIRVKQWDKYNEILGDVASQCEADELKANIEAIYPTLRPYKLGSEGHHGTGLPSSLATRFKSSPPSTSSPLWHQLTWAISESFLERVTGKKNMNEWLVDSSDCIKGDTHLPFFHQTASRAYKAAVSSELNFLFSEAFADLDLLDSHADPVDTSNRVLSLLHNPPAQVTERTIVAELQFTYVTGTQLGNDACLEQWWDLVLKIVLRSWTLAKFRPELCRNLLRTLHAQLIHTADHSGTTGENDQSQDGAGLSSDKPIFSTRPKNTRKLRLSLAVHKRRLNETLLELGNQITPEQEEVGRAFEELEAWLWKYKWDLRSDLNEDDGGDELDPSDDDDDDDDLPVVVELDEDGREVGLVSFNKD